MSEVTSGRAGAAVFDYCIIGGGIVGVATALSLRREQPAASIVVLEKEADLAQHQTGHNSGVIHSGIYYAPGSLKAQYCREGARVTKQMADELGVPYRTTGKLLVATNARELDRLAGLAERAEANRITVSPVSAQQLTEMEPNIVGSGALLVEETGILDYKRLTKAMVESPAAAGIEFRMNEQVVALEESVDRVVVSTRGGSVVARHVIACAGLQADRIARLSGIRLPFQIVPFRGEYYELPKAKSDIVTRLIYPVPDPAMPFLGVHISPTIQGPVTVGPNAVVGLAREKYAKYSVDLSDVTTMAMFPGLWRVGMAHASAGVREAWNSTFKSGYLRECRKYCPSLDLSDLLPREAGIRAQAVLRDGTLVQDFLIESTARTTHVLNAPSPAATSAIPIGRAIAHRVLP